MSSVSSHINPRRKPIVSTIRMTGRQFLQLHRDPPGVRLELVDGEIAVSPSPTPYHGYTVAQLISLLTVHVAKARCGQVFPDTDTRLGEHDVRRPDIIFFANERLHLVGEKAMEGPPDLCVEVISPASVQIDRHDKFEQYQQAGVAHYWLVDTEQRQVEGFALRGSKYELAGSGRDQDTIQLPPFADLDLPLARLWRPQSA